MFIINYVTVHELDLPTGAKPHPRLTWPKKGLQFSDNGSEGPASNNHSC